MNHSVQCSSQSTGTSQSTLHFISFPNKDEISLLLVVLQPKLQDQVRFIKNTVFCS